MEVQGLSTTQFQLLLTQDRQKLSLELLKLFSTPETLNLGFQVDKKAKCSQTNSNLDIKLLSTLFDKYFEGDKESGTKLIAQITSLLGKINGPDKFKQLIKTGGDLRFMVIILAINPMFEFEERQATITLSDVVSNLSSEAKRVLARWLEPMSDVDLLKRVEFIQTLLSVELLKLMPDEQEPDFPAIEKAILSLCKTLELFFLTNQYHLRIANEHFLNTQITENVDPMSQIKLSLKNRNGLNFTKFPFLLDLGYKSRLLEIESKIEQMVNLQRGIQDVTHGYLSQVDLSGNLTLDKILYLHFEVKRDNLLEDSITRLSQTKSSLKKPLRIAFAGEAGIDEGGVKAQYFQLITKQILNPFLGMFLPKNNNRIYWFNGNSLEPPINFQFVGTLLGLSIYNSIHLDLPFPKVIYKKLLAKENQQFNSLEDLDEIQPDIKAGLEKILKTEDLEGLDLTFEVGTQSFGQLTYYELKPKGSEILVTKQNREEYAKLYADYLLNKHIQKQFNAFKRGFFKVVTGHMIKTFFPDELEKVICGDPVLDFESLEKSTHYQGYTSESKIVKWFWGIVQKMDLQMKKAFLSFCTGSDRSPIKGLGSLGFVIQRQGPDTDNLPTAHTCNNVFMLPEYNSQQKLRQKLQLAIKNNTGFGLI